MDLEERIKKMIARALSESYDDYYDEDESSDDMRDFEDEEEEDYYHGFHDEDGIDFADPGGNSALRAASATNPRNRPCPSCGRENVLTPADVSQGYQCDSCADRYNF